MKNKAVVTVGRQKKSKRDLVLKLTWALEAVAMDDKKDALLWIELAWDAVREGR